MSPIISIIWSATNAACASTFVRWARSPAERIAIRRGPGKCSTSAPSARIAPMAARPRWAFATTRSFAATIATAPGINGEFLCIKGRYAADFVNSPERLQSPMIRRNGELEPVSWSEALTAAARKLTEVKARGGKFAVIGSNHTTNEENYYLQKFAREALGTNNIDHHRTGDIANAAGRAERQKGRAGDHRRSLRSQGDPGDFERSFAAASVSRVPDSRQLPASRRACLHRHAGPGSRAKYRRAQRRHRAGPRVSAT